MTPLLPSLTSKVDALSKRADDIPSSRRELLSVLVLEIRQRLAATHPIQLNFICTHNSRRSQLGQVWAAVAARVHDVPRVVTYSGGTEATAFNPRAVAAIERAGFAIEKGTGPNENNPLYFVRYSSAVEPARCFSKVFDDSENPKDDFVAVMTCGEADQNCPVILGAKRIPLLYDDPKIADDTDEETTRYDERSDQIGTELLWIFREVKNA